MFFNSKTSCVFGRLSNQYTKIIHTLIALSTVAALVSPRRLATD